MKFSAPYRFPARHRNNRQRPCAALLRRRRRPRNPNRHVPSSACCARWNRRLRRPRLKTSSRKRSSSKTPPRRNRPPSRTKTNPLAVPSKDLPQRDRHGKDPAPRLASTHLVPVRPAISAPPAKATSPSASARLAKTAPSAPALHAQDRRVTTVRPVPAPRANGVPVVRRALAPPAHDLRVPAALHVLAAPAMTVRNAQDLRAVDHREADRLVPAPLAQDPPEAVLAPDHPVAARVKAADYPRYLISITCRAAKRDTHCSNLAGVPSSARETNSLISGPVNARLTD